MASLLSASAAVKAALPVPLLPTPATAAVILPHRRRAAPVVVLAAVGGGKALRRGAVLVVAAGAVDDDLRPDIDEYPAGILSGEWPDNFSLLSYADLRAYLESQIVASDKVRTHEPECEALGRDVAAGAGGHAGPAAGGDRRLLRRAVLRPARGRPRGQVRRGRLEEGHHHQGQQRGQFDLDLLCLQPAESTVGEVMSSPAITLTHEKTVLEAAALMLKEKVHRIPVVNEQQHVIAGIVTRTDVFQALEANKA